MSEATLLPEEDQTQTTTCAERKALVLGYLLAGGRSDADAAALIGTDRSTVWRWRQQDPMFSQFAGVMGELPRLLPDGTLSDAPASIAERQQMAIDLFRTTGASDVEVAATVGIDRSTLWRWRKNDPAFAEEYKAARVVLIGNLKLEASRRALNGSDKLLMFLLCNLAPEEFKMVGKVEVNLHADIVEKLAAGRRRVAAG
jgi:transposase-like protein